MKTASTDISTDNSRNSLGPESDRQYIDDLMDHHRGFELQPDIEEEDEHEIEQDFPDENTPWLTENEDAIDPNDEDDHSSQDEMSQSKNHRYIKENKYISKGNKKKKRRKPSYAQDDVINANKPPHSATFFSKRKSDSFFMNKSGNLIPQILNKSLVIFIFILSLHTLYLMHFTLK